MSVGYNPKISTTGLVLCLDPANRKSYSGTGTVITDISKIGSTCALVNGVTYSTENGGVLSFDGVDDYVSANILNFFTSYQQQITIETWINVPAAATWNNAYEGVIVGRGNYGGSHGIFRSTTNNRINAWFRQAGATYGAVYASGDITRDTWNQCVAIWTGNSAQMYINGVLKQSANGYLGTTTSDSAFIIAGSNTAGGATAACLSCKIASTRIYNRALSSDEVLQNFNATRSRFGI